MSKTVAGVEISSPDKVLFPDSGLTKLDLARYYEKIADHILPHIRDKALSMRRYPDGIDTSGFFQKEAQDYFPDFVHTAELKKEGGTVNYVVADSPETLVYLANQGAVSLHPMLSKVEKPEHPVIMIFDLDPSDGDFGKVKQVARHAWQVLEDEGHNPRLKTTGSSGLHVVIPLDGTEDFDSVKEYAKDLAERVKDIDPSIATREARKKNRGDKVYVDVARNAYAQTAIAPYSVRARQGAPVAAPLDWDELDNSDLRPNSYTIKNIFKRLGQKDDPWKDFG